MEVENKTREITPLYKKSHAMSHDKQKSSKKENKKIKSIYLKKNLAHNMVEKKIKENSSKKKAPVRSQKNWAKGVRKDTLKSIVSAVVTCSSLCLKDAGSNPGNANRQKQVV